MKRGNGGWGAILCGLLAVKAAHAQPPMLPHAQLKQPAGAAGSDRGTATKVESGPPRLPPAPPMQVQLSPGALRPIVAQVDPKAEEADEFSSLVQLPTPKQLFELKSEAQLFERIRIEKLEKKLPMELPPMKEQAPIGTLPPRLWPTLAALAEPNYLCYRRLNFEQRAFERYGWNLGVIQPPISAAIFYADLLALPIYWTLDPCRDFECNTGLCLPGDPTPLMWYRRVK